MRNYVSGFRCASDAPPANLVVQGRYHPPRPTLPQPIEIRRDLYEKAPITLAGTETMTLQVNVPWFPQSMWLMDCPESAWPPFVGANWWPKDKESFIHWNVAPDGQRAEYTLTKGDSRLHFEAWVEGHSVLYRFDVKNVKEASLSSCCLKNMSPFFSSQERMTQGVVVDGKLKMISRMAGPGGSPFSWSAGEIGKDNCCGILRSFDGTAYVASVGKPPCTVGGNSSHPCMHLGPRADVNGEGGKLVFFLGPFEELKKELQYPDFSQARQR
jgi:hypothetical protein